MNITTIYRICILLLIGAIVAAVSSSLIFLEMLPQELLIYLSEVEQEEMSLWVLIFFLIILLAYVVSLIGIWLFKPWGRVMYVAFFVLSFAQYPVFGVVVMNPWEALFADISLCLEGAILAMIFIGPVSDKFVKN